jgi:intracellular septation protein A
LELPKNNWDELGIDWKVFFKRVGFSKEIVPSKLQRYSRILEEWWMN